MSESQRRAADLHKNVPPDWYAKSIKENIFQRWWHLGRFEKIGKLIPKTQGKILDIGCADGTFTKVVLNKSGASKVVGIDVLPQSVSYAKRRFARSKKMSFRVADAHKIPFPDRSFAGVVCLETLEHLENPDQVVAEIHRVLQDDGYAIVLVPSENLLFRLGWPIWTLWRGRIWKGTHLHGLPMLQLLRTVKKVGFRIQEKIAFHLGMLHAIKVVKDS